MFKTRSLIKFLVVYSTCSIALGATGRTTPKDLVPGLPSEGQVIFEGIWSDQLRASGLSAEAIDQHTRALGKAVKLALGLEALTSETEPPGPYGGRFLNPISTLRETRAAMHALVVLGYGAETTADLEHLGEDLQADVPPESASVFSSQYSPGTPEETYPRTFYPLAVFRADIVGKLGPRRTKPFSEAELFHRYLPHVLVELYANLGLSLESPAQALRPEAYPSDLLLWQLERHRRAVAVLFALETVNPFDLSPRALRPTRALRNRWFQDYRVLLAEFQSSGPLTKTFGVHLEPRLRPDWETQWDVLLPAWRDLFWKLHLLGNLHFADYWKTFDHGEPSLEASLFSRLRKSVAITFLSRNEWDQWTHKLNLPPSRTDELYGWAVYQDTVFNREYLLINYFLDGVFLKKGHIRPDAFQRFAKALSRSHGGALSAFLKSDLYEVSTLRNDLPNAELTGRGFTASSGFLEYLKGVGTPDAEIAIREEAKRGDEAKSCQARISAAAFN